LSISRKFTIGFRNTYIYFFFNTTYNIFDIFFFFRFARGYRPSGKRKFRKDDETKNRYTTTATTTAEQKPHAVPDVKTNWTRLSRDRPTRTHTIPNLWAPPVTRNSSLSTKITHVRRCRRRRNEKLGGGPMTGERWSLSCVNLAIL
jgi:hypothetical protein